MTPNDLREMADFLEKKSGKKVQAAKEDKVALNTKFNALMASGPFGYRQAAAYFNEPLKMKVPYVAIAPKVLDQNPIGNEIAYGDLEFPEIGAAKVPFKGAPAYVERGPKRVFFNTHSASINWKVPYDQMATAAYDQLSHAKDKVATGLALALDTELFAQLEATAQTGVYPTVVISSMSLQVVNQIRAMMAEFDLFTKSIILHYNHYYELLNVDAIKVDQVTLNAVLETGFVGNFYGVEFLVSKLCPKDAGYAVAQKEYTGKCVVRMPQQIKIADMSWKNAYCVTGYMNYGILFYNPFAIVKFAFADEESI